MLTLCAESRAIVRAEKPNTHPKFFHSSVTATLSFFPPHSTIRSAAASRSSIKLGPPVSVAGSMSDSAELTAAEKRARTKALRAREQAQEQARLIAAGGGHRFPFKNYYSP